MLLRLGGNLLLLLCLCLCWLVLLLVLVLLRLSCFSCCGLLLVLRLGGYWLLLSDGRPACCGSVTT